MSECPFCQLIENSNYIRIDRHPLCVAFEPLKPVVPGHMLIVPKLHVWSAAIIPEVTGYTFAAAADYAEHEYDPWNGRDFDYNLITSVGETATQTIKHLHVHLIPRRGNDGLRLPWNDALDNDDDRIRAMRQSLSRMVDILWSHLPPGGYYTEHVEIKRAEQLSRGA